MLCKLLRVAFPLLALTVPLRADDIPITQSETIPVQFTDWSQLITFMKFDPSQGTLTMVVVRLSASLEAMLCAENHSSGMATIMGQVSDQVMLAPTPPIAGVNPITSSATSMNPNPQVVGPYNSSISCPMPDSDQALWDIPSGTIVETSFASSDPAILAQFTGAGTVRFTANSDSAFMVQSNNGNAAVLVSAAAGATITLIYRYIPEPGTLGLLLLGGMLLLRRPRRRE